MTARVTWWSVGGLLLVWLVLVYVLFIDVPAQQEAPLKYRSGQAGARETSQGLLETWEVRSLHAPVRNLPATPKKNIFAMTAPPLSPEAHAQIVASRNRRPAVVAVAAGPPSLSADEVAQQQDDLAAQLARQQEALAVEALRQQEELRRKQVLEQMTQYRYLGYLNQQGIRKVFLGKGREIYIIRQGDTLEEKFLVVAIDASIVRIRLGADSTLETTIKLKNEDGSPSGT